MTKDHDKKRREFWLCGEPNEYDEGIWYDHHPGMDVHGKEFYRFHVIEYAALTDAEEKARGLVEALEWINGDPDVTIDSDKATMRFVLDQCRVKAREALKKYREGERGKG